MAKSKPAPLLKLGDRVRILLSGGLKGRIVDLVGPLGPGGPKSTESASRESRSRSTSSCAKISWRRSRRKANPCRPTWKGGTLSAPYEDGGRRGRLPFSKDT